MYFTILQLHSLCAYVVLIALTIAIINASIGFFSKKEYASKDLRISLFALIFAHIQLVIGIVLYFTSPLFSSWSLGMKTITQSSHLRKLLLEHPMMVIISVTLITIGWSLHKKQKTSQRAFGKIALFYLLGLISVLVMIPWGNWFA